MSIDSSLAAVSHPEIINAEALIALPSVRRYSVKNTGQHEIAENQRLKPTLRAHEIQVWQFSLELPQDKVTYLASSMDPEETARAARYASDKTRRHFIVGRGFLRLILSTYLECKPADVKLTYGANGKPYLSNPPGAGYFGAPIYFNLSHSNGMALCAITPYGPIGIDLEFIHPIHEIEPIARQFFSPREWTILSHLPEKDKILSFFNIWTKKEAYIKAIGDGFSIPFNQFSMFDSPEKFCIQPERGLTQGNLFPAGGKEWMLIPLVPPAGYAAGMVAGKSVVPSI